MTVAGATNQRRPRPLILMPKSVPLRHITVTRVDNGTSSAASSATLQAAIDSGRNVRSLLASSSMVPVSPGEVRAIAGVSRLASSDEAAVCRQCNSSPIVSACCIRGLSGRPPSADRPADRGEVGVVPLPEVVERGGVAGTEERIVFVAAVGAFAADAVLDHQHPHGRGQDAGHPADAVPVVVGDQLDLTPGCHVLGLARVRGPAFVERRGDDGASLGARHALPGDRRTGMGDDPPGQALVELMHGHDIDERWLCGGDPAQGFTVGRLHALCDLCRDDSGHVAVSLPAPLLHAGADGERPPVR
jgi:hypothetical protein